MDIEAVRAALDEWNLDGWLLYDFRGSNPIARQILGIAAQGMTTRRWFYLVRRRGEPAGLVHTIEPGALGSAPGTRARYTSWHDLDHELGRMLAGTGTIAMEYSPRAAVPYASRVDAGTIELVRQTGVDIVSSANLVQLFEARWTPHQKNLHDRAARLVLETKDEAFGLVRERLAAGDAASITESALQAYVSERLHARGLTFDHPCIVAVNEHAANPHFEPAPGAEDRPIRRGDLLLLDLWAKVRDDPNAVYYDTTWMAFCGPQVPARMDEVWRTVAGARDAAVACLTQAHDEGRRVRGCDVDDAARGHIEAHGWGPYFVHRTGHSIGTDLHGNGANIDNLETRDERELIASTAFSIEPGIYLPDFGVRSEIDVFMDASGPVVTGDIQRELALLAPSA